MLSNLRKYDFKYKLDKLQLLLLINKFSIWNYKYPAIINSIKPNLMTAISYADIGAYISIYVSNLSYESMDSLINSVHMELGEDYCVGSMLAKKR